MASQLYLEEVSMIDFCLPQYLTLAELNAIVSTLVGVKKQYAKSLDAMHFAEEQLSEKQYRDYDESLKHIVAQHTWLNWPHREHFISHTSARMRAEAFILKEFKIEKDKVFPDNFEKQIDEAYEAAIGKVSSYDGKIFKGFKNDLAN